MTNSEYKRLRAEFPDARELVDRLFDLEKACAQLRAKAEKPQKVLTLNEYRALCFFTRETFDDRQDDSVYGPTVRSAAAALEKLIPLTKGL
jgi:hypothetical protein